MLKQFPDDELTLARYGGTLYNQAVVLKQLKNPGNAEQKFREAIETQLQSVRLSPGTSHYATLLQQSLDEYATLIDDLGDNAGRNQIREFRAELATLLNGETTHAN